MTEPEQVPPEPVLMPRWIPVAIGGLLVVLAGLAVVTGIRSRDDTLTGRVAPRHDRSMNPAPPGEPGAGASLVFHGESGDNTPEASDAASGGTQPGLHNGPGGVETIERISARRGMVLNVLPEDTMVFVNEVPIGQVRQFNTMDEVYDFAEPGSYTVKIVAPNGHEKLYIVTAADDAQQEVARISAKL
jgi:hypothetical protein